MRNGVEERLEQALAEEDEKLSVAYEQRARLDQQIVASLTVVKRLKAIRDGGFVGSETVNTNGNGKHKDKRFHGKRDAIIEAAKSIRAGGGTWNDAHDAAKKLGYKAAMPALQKLVMGRPRAPRTKKVAPTAPTHIHQNKTRDAILEILRANGKMKAHDIAPLLAAKLRIPLTKAEGRVGNELSVGVKKHVYRRVDEGIYALPE